MKWNDDKKEKILFNYLIIFVLVGQRYPFRPKPEITTGILWYFFAKASEDPYVNFKFSLY